MSPLVALSDGPIAPAIPSRGFGTFQSNPQEARGTVKASVLAALRVGYRHIDTAWAYGAGQVEKEVGEAISESGVPREELFIVTKLHNTFHEFRDVEIGLDWSLKNLNLDYVDLFLMHNSYAYSHDEQYNTIRRSDGSGKPLIDITQSKNYPETWRAMNTLISVGKTKAIGVSNFNVLKLKRLIRETSIVPVANQVEFNPYFPQPELLNFCKDNGIQLIAHCPLGGAVAPAVAARQDGGPLNDSVIKDIARTYRKTAAQVILAWIIGQGACVIPKSNNPSRITENYDVCFKLTAEENSKIGSLMGEKGERAIRNLAPTAHIGFDPYDEDADQPTI